MAQLAAVLSSSSFTREWTYDVFLSFRGEDTRNTFTGHLYNSLHQKGIHTFIDDEGLRKGQEIKPALLKAIQESRIAIIVFSKDYAASTFCLDELVAILEHLKAQGRLVLPIFYDVDPSEVRHQRGSYVESLAKHEERYQQDKVKKWRRALHEAADLSGWHFKQGNQSEYKFIMKIVSIVSKRLDHTPLHIATNPVGLVSPVLEVKSLLGLGSNEGVHMVGICGTGGIGKTTIARAVYNLIADQFDGVCFLHDVREKIIHNHGLVQLQETLLSELLGNQKIRIDYVFRGIELIKKRLKRKKVLLIIDDVDNLSQLKALAGEYDWFGSGSRIIITSRNKHLLSVHGVKSFYEVKELNKTEALELLNWNAFRSNEVNPGYEGVTSRVLSYAGGLPLALEIIGSNLYNRSTAEWNSALDKYERIPIKEIHDIIRVSYDSLEDDEKNVFLDIACFFNKYKMSYVKEMLHARGFHPEHDIQVLKDKSLFKIDGNECVRMHDLVQDMGREIIRQESASEPGRRTRLWFDEDIVHVLQNDTGTDEVKVIIFNSSKHKKVHWSGKAFQKMRNLQVLIVTEAHFFSLGPKHLPNSLRVLDWNGYPSPSLPSDFHPNQLLILSLPISCLKLNKPPRMFDSLIFMDFEGCNFLSQVPDLSGLPTLGALCLDNCTNLTKVHDSIGFLRNLILLSAQGCIKLQHFVSAINLPSLETLDLRWCTSLESFPEVLGLMKNIREVYLDHTGISELPSSISNLIGLERLYLRRCTGLNQLPSSIRLLPELEVIAVYKHRGFRLYEPYKVQEPVMSKLVKCPSMYCVIIDDYNVSQGNSSKDTSLPEKVLTTARRGPTVSFWFRKRFPEVIALITVEPIDIGIPSSIFEFRFCVLINGIKKFSSSSGYMISETRGAQRFLVFLYRLRRQIEKEISVHEWNRLEVSCEIDYHRPNDPAGQTSCLSGTISKSILHLAKLSFCRKDIRFGNPDCKDSALDDAFCFRHDICPMGEDILPLFEETDGFALEEELLNLDLEKLLNPDCEGNLGFGKHASLEFQKFLNSDCEGNLGFGKHSNLEFQKFLDPDCEGNLNLDCEYDAVDDAPYCHDISLIDEDNIYMALLEEMEGIWPSMASDGKTKVGKSKKGTRKKNDIKKKSI